MFIISELTWVGCNVCYDDIGVFKLTEKEIKELISIKNSFPVGNGVFDVCYISLNFTGDVYSNLNIDEQNFHDDGYIFLSEMDESIASGRRYENFKLEFNNDYFWFSCNEKYTGAVVESKAIKLNLLESMLTKGTK